MDDRKSFKGFQNIAQKDDSDDDGWIVPGSDSDSTESEATRNLTVHLLNAEAIPDNEMDSETEDVTVSGSLVSLSSDEGEGGEEGAGKKDGVEKAHATLKKLRDRGLLGVASDAPWKRSHLRKQHVTTKEVAPDEFESVLPRALLERPDFQTFVQGQSADTTEHAKSGKEAELLHIRSLFMKGNNRNDWELNLIFRYAEKHLQFFKSFSPEVAKAMCKLARVVHFSKDEMVVKRGNLGTEFFIILSGSVLVHDPKANTDRNLKTGAGFPERNGLEPFSRSVTVHATSATNCLVYDFKEYERLCKSQTTQASSSLVNFISCLFPFNRWTRTKCAEFTAQLVKANFQAGDILYDRGDESDALFFLMQGTASVRMAMDFSHEYVLPSGRYSFEKRTVAIEQPMELQQIGPNSYFGHEMMLGEPRPCRVIAVTNLEALVFHRRQFATMSKENQERLEPLINGSVLHVDTEKVRAEFEQLMTISRKKRVLMKGIKETAAVRKHDFTGLLRKDTALAHWNRHLDPEELETFDHSHERLSALPGSKVAVKDSLEVSYLPHKTNESSDQDDDEDGSSRKNSKTNGGSAVRKGGRKRLVLPPVAGAEKSPNNQREQTKPVWRSGRASAPPSEPKSFPSTLRAGPPRAASCDPEVEGQKQKKYKRLPERVRIRMKQRQKERREFIAEMKRREKEEEYLKAEREKRKLARRMQKTVFGEQALISLNQRKKRKKKKKRVNRKEEMEQREATRGSQVEVDGQPGRSLSVSQALFPSRSGSVSISISGSSGDEEAVGEVKPWGGVSRRSRRENYLTQLDRGESSHLSSISLQSKPRRKNRSRSMTQPEETNVGVPVSVEVIVAKEEQNIGVRVDYSEEGEGDGSG